MNSATVPIKFVVGSRKIFEVRRPLQTVAFGLADLVAGTLPPFPDENADCDGYRVFSAPATSLPAILAAHPTHLLGGLQSYRRFYIDMAGGYEQYMARFSSKTRSTLNRKRRKLAEVAGGTLDIREYRTAAELDHFLADAIPLSHKTYQTRLLDAGLPEGGRAVEDMRAMAREGLLRAYLLYLDGKAVSYLYLPVADGVATYAFLGYDPDYAALSPGTVLQMEALSRLFAEKSHSYFDFTEGEGAHKQLFGTDSIEACSFFLLRRRASNRLLLGSLAAFDQSVAKAKRLAERNDALSGIRRMLRGERA
jgi:CelD/BcsL family acetyltransferase involved in cellulose biosynthesis